MSIRDPVCPCIQTHSASDYYSQCQPGAAAPSAASSSSAVVAPSVPVTPSIRSSAAPGTTLATSTTPSTPVGTGSGTATGPGKTLQSGYLWIRAVEAPFFHNYLQSSPLYSVGTAVLSSYTTAGQFNVVDGQLVQLVSAPGQPVKLLYGNVSSTQSFGGSSNAALAVTFSASKNTYGTFGFQGDGLTWSVAGITRPNAIAWYVCGANNNLYINLGNYLSNTPAGCTDETIHYYNDSVAND